VNKIIVRGVAGEIRWSYHRAATLGAWTIDAGRLTATVDTADAFKMTQSPLTFTVRRDSGVVWSWDLRETQINGSSLTATVVAEES